MVGGLDFQSAGELQEARERRQDAKDALVAHLMMHRSADYS